MNHFASPDFWKLFNIGRSYRALATEVDGGFLWGWIGSHAEYDRILS